MKASLETKRTFDSLCPHSLVVVVVVEELHVEQTVHFVATSQHSDENRQGREGDTQNIHRSYHVPHELARRSSSATSTEGGEHPPVHKVVVLPSPLLPILEVHVAHSRPV